MVRQSQPVPVQERTTILLSNKGTQYEKTTEVAATLMARDYKGFGNQAMNAVVEVVGGGRRSIARENPKFSKRTVKRHGESNND